MSNPFKVVALSMREIVHRISIPLVSCLDVGDVQNTIDQRVAEQHVRMGHVDLGTQYECSRFALATVHILEESQVLLNRAIAIGTVGARTGRRTFLLGDDLRTLLVDICSALFDEPDGKVPQLLEVVAGIVDICPLESQPLDIVLDTLDILCIFFDRVGVVEAEVANTAIFLGESEVNGNSLGMADVQVSVWLWWESRL